MKKIGVWQDAARTEVALLSHARYSDTGKSSFFGELVYERVVPQEHFLVALNELFPWAEMSADLIVAYRGQGIIGRRPYAPAQILKMLFDIGAPGGRDGQLSSGGQVVCGAGRRESAPDHSTLTQFKNRYLQGGHWARLQHVFAWIIQQAMALDLELGTLQVVDSTHTQADVNADKDDKRQKQGKPPRDGDAGIVNKGKRDVVEPDGRHVTKELLYKGYKTHVSVNAQTGITTSLKCTRGNQADNKQFPDLLAQDQALELPTEAYGDAAYDDTDLYVRLEVLGIRTAICLRSLRTEKKDPNKEPWLELVASEEYQRDRALRYRVEQPFGPAKQRRGFGRCRYLGWARYRIQALFTFMVCNCKRIVKLLTGITFRPQAKGRRAEVFEPVFAELPWA